MNDSYASGQTVSIAMSPPEASDIPTITQDTVDPSVVFGDRSAAGIMPEQVSIYADNITAVSYDPGNPMAAFDIVFTVQITCPDTNKMESYKIVKRVGVDRMKMAECAKMTTPVAVLEVEEKKPTTVGTTTARFQALAGLANKK